MFSYQFFRDGSNQTFDEVSYTYTCFSVIMAKKYPSGITGKGALREFKKYLKEKK